MSARKRDASRTKDIRNAKAGRDFFIGECYEAGIVLQGTEVKSIRLGNAQINDAYARIEKGAVWLCQAHIGEYRFGTNQNHDPIRKRKLLLHEREINKLRGAVEAGGKTIVPLRMYLKNGLVKVEIALGTGKKLYDKRETLKRKEAMREAERIIRARH
jgi:SsrA-binding protein